MGRSLTRVGAGFEAVAVDVVAGVVDAATCIVDVVDVPVFCDCAVLFIVEPPDYQLSALTLCQTLYHCRLVSTAHQIEAADAVNLHGCGYGLSTSGGPVWARTDHLLSMWVQTVHKEAQ